KGKTRRFSSRKTWKKPDSQIVLEPPNFCPRCGDQRRKKFHFRTRTVHDLVFGKGSVKGRLVRYAFQTYICSGWRYEYNVHHWYLENERKWGWNIVSYFIYHMAGLCISRGIIRKSMNRLYGSNLSSGTMHDFKRAAAKYYNVTKQSILDKVVRGSL